MATIDAEKLRTETHAVLARLRAARLSGGDAETEAFQRLFAARTPAHDDFWPLFNDLIGFLEAAPGDIGLFDAMAVRKACCLRHLRQAAERDRSLRRHNVETLLLSGDRLPYVDTRTLAMEIVRIDELCRALFGSAAPVPAAEMPIDLGRVSGREGIDRLLRFFTEADKG